MRILKPILWYYSKIKINKFAVRRETIGDVVCFLRLELTFTLIKTVLSLFDFLGEVKSLT